MEKYNLPTVAYPFFKQKKQKNKNNKNLKKLPSCLFPYGDRILKNSSIIV